MYSLSSPGQSPSFIIHDNTNIDDIPIQKTSTLYEGDPDANSSFNPLKPIQQAIERINLSNGDNKLKINEYSDLLMKCRRLEENEPSQELQELQNIIHKLLDDLINICLPELLDVKDLAKLYGHQIEFTIRNPEALKTCLESYIANTYCYIARLAQYLSHKNFIALLDFFPKKEFLGPPNIGLDIIATPICLILCTGPFKEKAESVNKILSHFKFNEKEIVTAFGHVSSLLRFSVKTHDLDLFLLARKISRSEKVEICPYSLQKGIDEATLALKNEEISKEYFRTFFVNINTYAYTYEPWVIYKKSILNYLFENWAKAGCIEIIKILLESGADVDLYNFEELCAYDWIMQNTYKMPETVVTELFMSIPQIKQDYNDLNPLDSKAIQHIIL